MISLGYQNHEAVTEADRPRLETQYQRIMRYMGDHQWHTQYEIAEALDIPQGSVGSQLRNARVDGCRIEKRRGGANSGTWQYRLCEPENFQPNLI